jgi:type I restriction enzyme S subunit
MKILKNKCILKEEKLSNIVSINLGQSPPSSSYVKYDNGNPFFQGVAEFGIVNPLEKIYTNEPKKWAKKGEILLSVRAPVGRLNKAHKNLVIGRGLSSLKPNNKFNDDYVYFLLKSRVNDWKRYSAGAIFEAVNKKNIENFPISIIEDLNQQNKIAQFLSQQETQVNNIKTLIEKLEKRNQYYSERLLSGELRVREGDDGKIEFYENTEWKEVKQNGMKTKVPITWSLKKVEDLAELINGFAFKKNEMLNKGKYPVIKMNNFKNGNIEINDLTKYTNIEKENVKLRDGDLVMGLSGSIGSTAVFKLTTSCLLNQRCLIIRSKEHYLFIKNCLTGIILKFVKKEAQGGVIANLSHKDIASFEICYSDNHLLISEIIDSLKNEKNKIEKILEKEQKRFDWMSDALLSGEYQIVD